MTANTIKIVRAFRGRTLTLHGSYSEKTADWTIVLFENGKPVPLDLRTTADVFAEAADMLNLAVQRMHANDPA